MRANELRLAVVGVRGIPGVIGGIESHCETLYPALAKALPELRIIVLARRRYVAAARYTFDGVEVRSLASPRGTALEALVHSFWAVLYARFALGARIVQLHGIGPGFFAPLARFLGMNVVVTHHAQDYQRPKWGRFGRAFLRTGERLAGTYADRIICVSEALRSDFVARAPHAEPRTVAIRHAVRQPAVDAEARAALLAALGLEDRGYILAVGRLDETKRLDDLLIAHRDAAPGTLPLVIVGSGREGYMRRLRRVAGPDAHFVGFRTGPELAALYEGAAMLCHPSGMEGFGLVILEALCAGVPVTASDIPVHREFGLPEDAYFAVGDRTGLRRVLEAARPRSGPWPPAEEIIRRHSHEAFVAEHAAVFKRLAAFPPSGACDDRLESASHRTQPNIVP